MEKHKCKLCARAFSNGRALGGHMKGHLAIHPLPPRKPTTQMQQRRQLGGGDRTDSASSSSSSSGEEQEVEEEKSLGYGLRENPKKSSRFVDPEFSFAVAVVESGPVVVLDRDSETESRNPTRKRSKRYTTSATDGTKKPKVESPPTEPEPVSSVSDTSPEEHVAMCLMMLSRDVWKSKKKNRSYHTLDDDEHQRVCSETKTTSKTTAGGNNSSSSRIFECPLCYRVFGSGQALGGHKRSHLITANSGKLIDNNLMIDLNLPAPLEEEEEEDDDEFSVVSDEAI